MDMKLRLTHTGLAARSVLLDKIDRSQGNFEGYALEPKFTVYVPVLQSVEIPFTDNVRLAYERGNIRRLIEIGHLNGEIVEDGGTDPEPEPGGPISITGWDFTSDDDFYILRGTGFLAFFDPEEMLLQVSGQDTWTFDLSQPDVEVTDTEIRILRDESPFRRDMETDWVTVLVAGEEFASNAYRSPSAEPYINGIQFPFGDDGETPVEPPLALQFICRSFYSSTDDYLVEKLVGQTWVPVAPQHFQWAYDAGGVGTYCLVGFGLFEDSPPGYQNGTWRVSANGLASETITI